MLTPKIFVGETMAWKNACLVRIELMQMKVVSLIKNEMIVVDHFSTELLQRKLQLMTNTSVNNKEQQLIMSMKMRNMKELCLTGLNANQGVETHALKMNLMMKNGEKHAFASICGAQV